MKIFALRIWFRMHVCLDDDFFFFSRIVLSRFGPFDCIAHIELCVCVIGIAAVAKFLWLNSNSRGIYVHGKRRRPKQWQKNTKTK